jgi:hypothetical protein
MGRLRRRGLCGIHLRTFKRQYAWPMVKLDNRRSCWTSPKGHHNRCSLIPVVTNHAVVFEKSFLGRLSPSRAHVTTDSRSHVHHWVGRAVHSFACIRAVPLFRCPLQSAWRISLPQKISDRTVQRPCRQHNSVRVEHSRHYNSTGPEAASTKLFGLSDSDNEYQCQRDLRPQAVPK